MFRKYFEKIETKLEKLNLKVIAEYERRDSWERNKEGLLFEMVSQKSQLEEDKNKLLKEKITLKDELSLKEKLVTELERETTSGKQTIKNLLDEINSLVKFKNENEELKKENKKLEKENNAYKERYGNLPTKVPGSTMPRKKQVIGVKQSNTSGATKKELKKINELREREE